MDHLEFAAIESAGLVETDWERWAKAVEVALGSNLDGDESEDGYSIDGALEAYEACVSVARYVGQVRENRLHLGLSTMPLHRWCFGYDVRTCPVCCAHMVAFDSAILHQRPFSNMLRGDVRTFNVDRLPE